MQDTFTLNLNKILHMTVVVVGVFLCTKRFFEGTASQINEDLYGLLLKLSGKIRDRRIRVAGHCVSHKKEEASKLVLCIHNTDKLREEDLGPRTYTLCLRTLGSPPSENSELQC